MKIAVYTITKNEAHFIERWANSCIDADYRLVVDTGSTDNTLDVAREAGCSVASICISPWRFDDARNASLALVPDWIDMCIALDADEVLVPGWREHLESVPEGTTRPRYEYTWSWNADGSPGLIYGGDKIHARRGYRWKHPVHEVITPTGEERHEWCGLKIHHHPDPLKSRGQYFPLLELAARESPTCDRTAHYLAREYYFNHMLDKAAAEFKRHLALPTALWKAERAKSMRYLAKCEPAEAETWLLRATAEDPHRREPWVELAGFYYHRQHWAECYAACERALQIKERSLDYLSEADAWSSYPHDIASISAWRMGLIAKAMDHAVDALRKEPSHPRLLGNCRLLYALTATTPTDIVIPFKSNSTGLTKLLNSLTDNKHLGKVMIVADGPTGLANLSSVSVPDFATVLAVPPNVGIHRMWNIGIANASKNNHIAFINDDVVLESQAIDVLSSFLDRHTNVGLVCPQYDGRSISDIAIDVDTTARGRYDGSGGLAGFCMVLGKELALEWKFDESLKWWYGDDDIVNWVRITKKKKAMICAMAHCSENNSWTINNDPPPDFVAAAENDRRIFAAKWPTN